MRTLDQPLPDVTLDSVPSIAHWPIRPVIAIESQLPPARWDDPDALWDDPELLWDGDPNATGWRDATCSWTGLEIDSGVSDDAHLYPATRAVIQLDNRDGSWSGLDPDGTQSEFGPGTPIHIYAHNDEDDWWLFSGFVSRWDQRADDSIEVEAFDSFSDLAQTIGTYTPGSNGQKPHARLNAVLAAAGESARLKRFDTGLVALTAQETDLAPLEEMQIVAQSDGGVLFVDADGTLLYRDRQWRLGRSDQVGLPVASDNVCTVPYVVWDAVISANDEGLADVVVLENVAGLRADEGTTPGFVFSLIDQQWTLQEEGDALAALLLNDQSPRTIKVEEFDLYLLDPHQPELWKAVDWRRLDQLRFLHDSRTTGGGTVRVDITTLIDGVLHSITPDGWLMSVTTSKVIGFSTPILYDTGHLYDTGEEYGF